MDVEVHRAPCGRSSDAPLDPEMVESRSIGGWPVVRDESGNAAGLSGFAATCERVSLYVFDLWGEAWRQKVVKGEVIVVRYADDLVVGFEYRTDAEQFLKAFQERLAKFGLEVNAEK